MIRKKLEWKFRDHALELGPNTLIVGVLNVTPDSFSDGGSYSDPDEAAARALDLQEQGADIIDIGAESTRPGSERVSEAEELRRLVPVLKRLKGKLDIPISVDTYKVAVAEAALEHGAHIINDVSGLTWEPDLAKTVLHNGAGLILNHMRGTPETWAKLAPMRAVMGEIVAELEASLHRAVKAGLPSNAVVVDPGIGFGKRKEQNSEILARLREMTRLPVPILVGPSRKSFLAQESAEATEFATAAAVTAAILNGAYLIRVHDVAAMRPVIAVADAVLAAVPERAEAPPTRVARRTEEGQMRELGFGEEAPRRPVVPPALSAKKKAEKDVRDLPLLRRKRAADAPDAADDDRPVDPREAQHEWESAKPRRDFRDRPEREDRPRRDDRPRDDRPPREDRGPRDDRGGDRPAWGRGRPAAGGGDRPATKRPFRRDDDRPPMKRPFRRDDDDRPAAKRPFRRDGDDRPATKRPFRRDDDDRPAAKRPFRRDGDDRPATKRPFRRDGDDRPAAKRPFRRDGDDRPAAKRPFRRDGDDRPAAKRPFRRDDDDRPPTKRPFRPGQGGGSGGPKRPGGGAGRGPSTPRKRS